jgi:hypothetical protein
MAEILDAGAPALDKVERGTISIVVIRLLSEQVEPRRSPECVVALTGQLWATKLGVDANE